MDTYLNAMVQDTIPEGQDDDIGTRVVFIRLRHDGELPYDTFQAEASVDVDKQGQVIGVTVHLPGELS